MCHTVYMAATQTFEEVAAAVDFGTCLENSTRKDEPPMSTTNWLYRLARASNDARAVRQGPAALGKRLVRKRVYRTTGRSTRRVLKSFGLSK